MKQNVALRCMQQTVELLLPAGVGRPARRMAACVPVGPRPGLISQMLATSEQLLSDKLKQQVHLVVERSADPSLRFVRASHHPLLSHQELDSADAAANDAADGAAADANGAAASSKPLDAPSDDPDDPLAL